MEMKFLHLSITIGLAILVHQRCHAMPSREAYNDNNMNSVATRILKLLDGPCQMYNISDTITREGCLPVKIENKFCGGKCLSRIYPNFSYCTACMPSKVVMKKVFFKCPKDPVKKIRHRRVKVVVSCQCKRFMC
eukprot:gene17652-19407_t